MKFEAINDMVRTGGVSGVCGTRSALATAVLIKIDLSRGFGESLEGTPSLGKVGNVHSLAVGLRIRRRSLWGGTGVGDAMELEAGSHAVRLGDGGAFLGDVGGQAIDAALGEVLAALLTGVRVPVAVVVELGASDEVLEDERVGLAAHCELRARGRGLQAPGPQPESVKASETPIPPKIQSKTSSPVPSRSVEKRQADGTVGLAELVMGIRRG